MYIFRSFHGKEDGMKISRFSLYAGIMCFIIMISLFSDARSVSGIPIEIPQLEKTEQYFTARCGKYSVANKTVCTFPSSTYILDSKQERRDFERGFSALVMLTRGLGIPAISWLDVTVTAETNEVFLWLSDGDVMYAGGVGGTFKQAMDDMVKDFLGQHEDRYFEEDGKDEADAFSQKRLIEI